MAGGILQRGRESGQHLRIGQRNRAAARPRCRDGGRDRVGVGQVDVGEEEIAMRGKIARRIDVLVFNEMGGFGTAEIDRRVVGTDHRYLDVLGGDAAGMVVELHHIGDVEMLAGRQVVEREIGRRECRVDGAGAGAGVLDDVVDMEERHQLGVTEDDSRRVASRRKHGGGMAGVGEIVVGEIQRDLDNIGGKRQGSVGLLGHGRQRRRADHRPVVGAGDGYLHGLYGGAAVVVGNRNVVSEDERLVLGKKIEIVIGVGERPFQFSRAIAVAGDLGRHRGLETPQRRRGNDRTARYRGGMQRRRRRMRVAVVRILEIHRARQRMQGGRIRGVGGFGEAAGRG